MKNRNFTAKQRNKLQEIFDLHKFTEVRFTPKRDGEHNEFADTRLPWSYIDNCHGRVLAEICRRTKSSYVVSAAFDWTKHQVYLRCRFYAEGLK